MMKKEKFIYKKNARHLSIDKLALKRICLAKISDFSVPGFLKNLPNPEIIQTAYGVLIYFDMGSDILGVAHLDSYGEKFSHFEQIQDRIYTASVDDRVGAYIVTEMLEQKKYPHDILLTVGEESGNSTAQFFTTAKQYNWMFQFDRSGKDTVMYDFETSELIDLIKEYGWHVGIGSYSDIVYLDHLDCKGFNFATGFYDYHNEYAYIDIIDTENSVRKFTAFYSNNKDVYMEHEAIINNYGNYSYYDFDDDNYNKNNLADLVTCINCHKSFNVTSKETITIYHVDDILSFGTCSNCTFLDK